MYLFTLSPVRMLMLKQQMHFIQHLSAANDHTVVGIIILLEWRLEKKKGKGIIIRQKLAIRQHYNLRNNSTKFK